MPKYKDPRWTYSSERDALAGFLDYQREGLILTLDGLDDAAARKSPSASSLSLLGLIKHAATWERRWFQVVVAGRELPENWPAVWPEPVDADMLVDESDTVAHAIGYYREQIEESRAVVASVELDSPCARTDIIDCNVRYVLLHMIEETARHGGHADIIRETLDGVRQS